MFIGGSNIVHQTDSCAVQTLDSPHDHLPDKELPQGQVSLSDWDLLHIVMVTYLYPAYGRSSVSLSSDIDELATMNDNDPHGTRAVGTVADVGSMTPDTDAVIRFETDLDPEGRIMRR